ncbi:peptidylprolyl isomerase [Arachidicoccus ginsenosidimutans]|uniref:peptidylprolyl isomerase n=1 Tax=Arachidicoccus sp. BS20 TaxID=1850526 RepID=UPI0007F10293|nr:peptidylprolyl isomerase [Arachidicoccus sp. BS20]ANI88171.1 peptidylprolyl isomerase [Arachidicoccus sp. BS20]
MKKLFFILTTILLVYGCTSHHKYTNPHVLITTKLGDIEVELYPKQAPKTVAAFLSYVDSGLYSSSNFYRVLNRDNQPSNASKVELIQGGIWQTNPAKYATLKGIPHESTKKTGILHKNGTISLAREEPGTATSEFFICIGDQPGYDSGGVNNPDKLGYAAFGRVVKGMDIVLQIYNRNENNQYFDPPIPIYSIKHL